MKATIRARFHAIVRFFQRIGLRIEVRCVGDGSIEGGCGYRGGVGGYCCPKCGGMLLSRNGRKSAARLQRQWDAEAEAKLLRQIKRLLAESSRSLQPDVGQEVTP